MGYSLWGRKELIGYTPVQNKKLKKNKVSVVGRYAFGETTEIKVQCLVACKEGWAFLSIRNSPLPCLAEAEPGSWWGWAPAVGTGYSLPLSFSSLTQEGMVHTLRDPVALEE